MLLVRSFRQPIQPEKVFSVDRLMPKYYTDTELKCQVSILVVMRSLAYIFLYLFVSQISINITLD